MTQQLIIYALRNRIESGAVRYYYGDWIVVYRGREIEECLEAFFSACCEDVKYTQSQEYFADFAENNEFKFYENDIRIRH